MDGSAYERALQHALRFRASLSERPVGASASADELRAALGGRCKRTLFPPGR